MKRLSPLIILLFSVLLFHCNENEVIIPTDSRPSPPVNFSAASGDEIAYLKWQQPLNGGSSDIIQYNIYRSQAQGNGILITSTAPNTFSYNDSSLTNGTAYYYYITAVNNEGEGERSNQVSVRPVLTHLTPSEPRNVQAALTNKDVTLTWLPPYTHDNVPHFSLDTRRKSCYI